MRSIRKQREKLHKEAGGNCNYCGIKTILPQMGKSNDSKPNLATIDHLFSNLHPYRLTPNHNNEKRHVLSCFKCNQQRSVLEQIVRYFIDGTFYLKDVMGRLTLHKTRKKSA